MSETAVAEPLTQHSTKLTLKVQLSPTSGLILIARIGGTRSNHGNQRTGRKGWGCRAEGAGRSAAVLWPFPGVSLVAGKSGPEAASFGHGRFFFAAV